MSANAIRIIVVGCGGGRGSWFVEQLAGRQDYRIVALVDQLPAATQVVANHYDLPDVPIYADTVEALQHEKCDAVLVATPDGAHTAPVLAALALGKHVYVEKPLAINLADCLAIIQADEATGRRTMVGFNLRFAPLYSRLHEMVADGAVGQVLTIQADEFYYGGRTYFRRWNRLRRFGGGLWITKASHDFDLLYWLAGVLPARISASARLTHYVPKPEAGLYCHDCAIEPDCPDSHLRDANYAPPLKKQLATIREAAGGPSADLCLYNSDKDTFDHGVAQVEFENNALAVYTVNVVAPFTDRRIRIAGTDGTIQGRLGSSDLLYWRRHQADDPNRAERIPLMDSAEAHSIDHGGGDAFVLDDFAAFVRDQPSRAIGPAEASVAIAAGLAATQSSDTSRTTSLAELAEWTALKTALHPAPAL